ncbi:MAG: sigma-70 family RNA polymerase sigma factor [Burkholderiaceae bacterium]|nr:sigma-70 family RNA polymerase sigma factor [Burkholderiaceae bacterium]
MRAWTRAAQWRAGSDLAVWLLSIMHNLRVDQLRRPGPPLTFLDTQALEVPVRATQTDQRELADLARALAQLPEEQRAVLLLVGLEGLGYAEVAATLDIPIGTVMSRLARGRERLRHLLAGQESAPQLRVVR